ncbi:MAG: PfkB family carbohydrate kinase [Verrucomicrobiota bacterium JB024]|nr:PfkB family carbohydrate kinase [Verrucomicrobiota bacterium JB024]
MKPNLAALADRLDADAAHRARLPVVAGFDAFVDERIHVVGERQSEQAFTPVATITNFAEWAARSAGRSGLREFVFQTEAGGCTVNMGDGVATLGFPLTAFAGVGSPAHPAFAEFTGKCAAVEPLGMEPGRALVYDFADGKLMFCAFNHFSRFTPEYLREKFADGKFRAACEAASALVLTSWSVYPHMTECWRYLYEEALAGLPQRPHFFLDLADPASRPRAQLATMLDTLGGFEKLGPVTLSLNGNEANQLAQAVGLAEADESPEQLERLAGELRDRAGITTVGIHLVKSATAATAEGAATVAGPYCAKPTKSVGAGDRFNAGWLSGILLDLPLTEQLAVGCASSGFFVRHARSATWPELTAFLREWQAGDFNTQAR